MTSPLSSSPLLPSQTMAPLMKTQKNPVDKTYLEGMDTVLAACRCQISFSLTKSFHLVHHLAQIL